MKLTRADKLLIAVLMVLALGGMGAGVALFPATSTSQAAEIWVEGRLVRTMALRPGFHEEIRIGGSEHYNIIEADDGRIRIREADCSDQVCTRTGWIKMPPEQIVCLPHRVVIKINSSESGEVDDIVR